MYKVHGKWIQVNFIYKATTAILDETAEQWQRDQAMNEAEIIISKEWILRDTITGLREATNQAKETLEEPNIALLSLYGDEPTHILFDEKEELDFLDSIGPDSIYSDNGNRKEL